MCTWSLIIHWLIFLLGKHLAVNPIILVFCFSIFGHTLWERSQKAGIIFLNFEKGKTNNNNLILQSCFLIKITQKDEDYKWNSTQGKSVIFSINIYSKYLLFQRCGVSVWICKKSLKKTRKRHRRREIIFWDYNLIPPHKLIDISPSILPYVIFMKN